MSTRHWNQPFNKQELFTSIHIMVQPVLELDKIQKTFRPGTSREIVAINDFSVTFDAGEWCYIVGGNGCGKSTLLRTISGELRPDSGEVRTVAPRYAGMCFVEGGTTTDLVPSMTVYENLLLANPSQRRIPSFRPYRDRTRRNEFIAVLEPFGLGLETRLDEQVACMSSGQQQVVVAAKVLLSGKKTVLLDEFTSALDKRTAPAILDILKRYGNEVDATIIAVTHDYHWIESTADRVILMDSGRIKEVLWAKDHALTAPFIMERLYGDQ